MSGDGWKTPSYEFWSDVPRFLRRWRALSLGALSFCKYFFFLLLFYFFLFFIFG